MFINRIFSLQTQFETYIYLFQKRIFEFWGGFSKPLKYYIHKSLRKPNLMLIPYNEGYNVMTDTVIDNFREYYSRSSDLKKVLYL